LLISRITNRANKRRLFSVYVDGTLAFDISDAVLLKFGLRTGDAIDDSTIHAIKLAENEKQAQLTAVNYLSYRPRSSREVHDHLVRKGFSRELADFVVRHFKSVSLIQDLEFARMFVRDRIRRRPTGRALLHRQLAAKGIDNDTIDQVLTEFISDEDQREAATTLASKRMRLTKESLAKLDPLKRRQRMTGYLLRHGFSNEIVQKTIQSLFQR
jgi:regulatory protein